MWKNVRGIIAIGVIFAYVIFTGYEVYVTGSVSDNFYAVSSMIATAYFVTRANETKGGGPTSTPE